MDSNKTKVISMRVCIILICLFVNGLTLHGQNTRSESRSIVILQNGDIKKNKLITQKFYTQNPDQRDQQDVVAKESNGSLKWIVNDNGVVHVICQGIDHWFLEPGDSVVYDMGKGIKPFSGKGSEKFNVLYEFEKTKYLLPKPTGNVKLPAKDLEEFYLWHYFVERRLIACDSILLAAKSKISQNAYDIIRNNYLIAPATDASRKFFSILPLFTFNNVRDTAALTKIYDNTIGKTVAKNIWKDDPLSPPNIYGSGVQQLVLNDTWREQHFSIESEKNSRTEGLVAYLDYVNKHFTGRVRERLYSNFLLYVRGRAGANEVLEKLIDGYLKSPGFPEFKAHFKVELAKFNLVKKGEDFGEFSFNLPNGNKMNSKDLQGKVLVLDFWFTGCPGCIIMKPALQKIRDHYRQRNDIQFVSVNVDENLQTWKTSLIKKNYSIDGALDANSNSASGSISKRLNITAYPSLLVLDSRGKIADPALADPRTDTLVTIDVIDQILLDEKDGPYLFGSSDNTIEKRIDFSTNTVREIKVEKQIQVGTDKLDKTFQVDISDFYTKPSSSLSSQSKILALSDIEGNFTALRKLLLANKVIDENFNWIFGNGQLVIVGDFVDRGSLVIECLWLIYKLDRQSRQSGGKVNYVLGNHELMLLAGNNFYLHDKYKSALKILNLENTVNLFDKDSELGRWLRTKNVMEKVGDYLFVHGGVSPQILNLGRTIDDLNNMAKNYYGISVDYFSSKDSAEVALNHERLSPAWYRAYYQPTKTVAYDNGKTLTVPAANQALINKTLSFFDVKKILTGHTIVGDNISAHFENKVINLDTHHAGGKSESLLIEDGSYYRINDKGERALLFKEVKSSSTKK